MKKTLLLPQNIFSRIFFSELNREDNIQFQFLNSALIAQKLKDNPDMLGLIPVLDLLRFNDLFISSEIGISFNALLSNSYLHFKEGQESLNEIFLKGDVSSNEVILSKILFKEFYDVDVKHTLVADDLFHQHENLLIVGDENYQKELFLNGLSFAEEVIELISAPYVDFVLASSSENTIEDFTLKHKNEIQNGHPENLDDLLKDLPSSSIEFISVNLQHVIFDFEDQDLEGIKTIMQMPYFHGMIKDIPEVKFI
jgi:hypothetical protein